MPELVLHFSLRLLICLKCSILHLLPNVKIGYPNNLKNSIIRLKKISSQEQTNLGGSVTVGIYMMRNHEGYHDPTAGKAIRRAHRAKRRRRGSETRPLMYLIGEVQGISGNHGLKEKPENMLVLPCEYQWFSGKSYVN